MERPGSGRAVPAAIGHRQLTVRCSRFGPRSGVRRAAHEDGPRLGRAPWRCRLRRRSSRARGAGRL